MAARARAARTSCAGPRTTSRAARAQLEDPRGLIMFGLRREVLEDRLAEPEEVLDGIEAVTAADVQRRRPRRSSSTTGSTSRLVGPFDDENRFLELLAA